MKLLNVCISNIRVIDKSSCCRFLNEVQSFSSTNKMSIQNLATVFGPNILRPKAEDPESIIGGKKHKTGSVLGKLCWSQRSVYSDFEPVGKKK